MTNDISRRRVATISEVANRTGANRSTIWRRIKAETIPAVQLGKKWFISLEYVTALEQEAYKENLNIVQEAINE